MSVHIVYISFGSNIGDREEYIIQALSLLHKHQKIVIKEISSLYETVPVGYVHQRKFINGVVRIDTELSYKELLGYIGYIEDRLGRRRVVHWGPRTIDLDILLYDDICITTSEICIPHSEMHKRAFVLVPLNEIAPDVVHPVLHMTISELIEDIDIEGCKKIRDSYILFETIFRRGEKIS
jgi:2-amino-4-hydroxy-6-hydroxymethyldihydropteridine diphosphokinase